MANYHFAWDYQINSHDCDINNHVTPSGLLRYLQETANHHVEQLGKGYDVLKKEGQAFILSRVAVSLHRPLYAYERLQGRTTPEESKGVSFLRTITLYQGEERVATLSSLWALVNVEDKSLVRVADAHLNMPTGKGEEHEAPLKFRIPKEVELEELGTFRADYSLCDRNHHMNNTTYPNVLCNLLKDEQGLPFLSGKRIASLSLAYLSEMPYGATATAFAGRDEQGVLYFRTVREDGKTGVEARMVFEDLKG